MGEQPDFAEPALNLDGAAAHWDHREDEDYFSQPGDLFRLMTAEQQAILFDNTTVIPGGVPKEIQLRPPKTLLQSRSSIRRRHW
ncbi:hypothetical protein OH492_11595 [Vibrio chagasii]|nr:hypothetical protein [Vibrio chagasii]